MADVLSQAQIDALLGNLMGGGSGLEEAEPEAVLPVSEPGTATFTPLPAQKADPVLGKKVKTYDFRSPKLFTREQLKILFSIYENYAKMLSSQITGTLQTYSLVEMLDAEEQKYYEFNNALPDSVLMGIIDFPIRPTEDEDFMLIEISKDIGFCVVDKLLGGTGKPLEDDREYTDIEITVLEFFMKNVVSLMKNIWYDLVEVTPTMTKIETNARIMQGISPDENVVIVAMTISVNETQGRINICIPAATLAAIFKIREALSRKNSRRADPATEIQRRRDIIANVYETNLEMRGVLGSVILPAKDVVELEVGDVIKLDKRENSLVELTVGETVWFMGDVGSYNKKRAIAIREKKKRMDELESELPASLSAGLLAQIAAGNGSQDFEQHANLQIAAAQNQAAQPVPEERPQPQMQNQGTETAAQPAPEQPYETFAVAKDYEAPPDVSPERMAQVLHEKMNEG